LVWVAVGLVSFGSGLLLVWFLVGSGLRFWFFGPVSWVVCWFAHVGFLVGGLVTGCLRCGCSRWDPWFMVCCLVVDCSRLGGLRLPFYVPFTFLGSFGSILVLVGLVLLALTFICRFVTALVVPRLVPVAVYWLLDAAFTFMAVGSPWPFIHFLLFMAFFSVLCPVCLLGRSFALGCLVARLPVAITFVLSCCLV